MSSCNPKDIIRKSEMQNKLHYSDGSTEDIVSVILRKDREADQYIDKAAAQCLRGKDDYETLRNVWRFVKYNVRYKTDRPGKEIVKSPAALFELRSGDCKSFSISEAALLRALGFKGIRYRFTSYKNNKVVTHVYIVVKSGGEDVILDAVYGVFDQEDNYKWKKDLPASQRFKNSAISGLPPEPKNTTPILIALGLFAWVLFK